MNLYLFGGSLVLPAYHRQLEFAYQFYFRCSNKKKKKKLEDNATTKHFFTSSKKIFGTETKINQGKCFC